ncbi:hypothetical protein ACGFY7_07760 [Streptomyces prunicolor]
MTYEYESAPRPEPAPGEFLVAVRAASITSGELDRDAGGALALGIHLLNR